MDFTDCPDVRVAAPEDELSVLRLMQLACEEDGQHSLNLEKVRSLVVPRLYLQGGLVGVIGTTELYGYIFMVVQDVWYSDEKQLLELSLFVHPDHRRSNYAKQLMAFGKRTAEGTHLDLTIGVMSNERTAAKVRLYQRQFATAGAFFVYRPENRDV